jgi:hypothetical protein
MLKRHPRSAIVYVQIAFHVFDGHRDGGRIDHHVDESSDIFRIEAFAEVEAETVVGGRSRRLLQHPRKGSARDEAIGVRENRTLQPCRPQDLIRISTCRSYSVEKTRRGRDRNRRSCIHDLISAVPDLRPAPNVNGLSPAVKI